MNKLTHLSFSRLKALAHSPLALQRYIEQTRSATKAMDEGTLLDVLLFTPERFDETFYLMPDVKKPTAAQLNAKKPSDETLAQIAAWEAMIAEKGERIGISAEQLLEARILEQAIRNNSTVAFQGLLHPHNFKFPVPVEFFNTGFNPRGKTPADGRDRNGNRVVWDLKRMGGRSGEALVRAQIRANLYDLQGAIYCHEEDIAGEPIKYYIIAVDNEGYVTPFEIGRDAREKARYLWHKLISAAHRVNLEGFDMGCEFWGDSEGFFQF